jgi:phosphoribosylaminoimidazolecarboxamide formyltransferase/IMP cyclohydrolase
VQTADDLADDPATWQVVTERKPDTAELEELLFAWRVVKHVKSNAIVVTRDRTTLGIGAGQMNRVGSVNIALDQAGSPARAVSWPAMASSPSMIRCERQQQRASPPIVQPGGSKRDEDSIKAANELGLVMAFTGVRHFLH